MGIYVQRWAELFGLWFQEKLFECLLHLKNIIIRFGVTASGKEGRECFLLLALVLLHHHYIQGENRSFIVIVLVVLHVAFFL